MQQGGGMFGLHSYFHGPLQISAQNLLSFGKVPMDFGFCWWPKVGRIQLSSYLLKYTAWVGCM